MTGTNCDLFTQTVPVIFEPPCVCVCVYIYICRNIVVGIATRYGLDDPGTESRLGRDISDPSRPASRLNQSPGE